MREPLVPLFANGPLTRARSASEPRRTVRAWHTDVATGAFRPAHQP
ncbi:hypothetical protein N9M16_05780 [Candidatus Dependentiae bacterium]|nr:hypothetical protein [Candidatus Dependentiae bacterium]